MRDEPETNDVERVITGLQTVFQPIVDLTTRDCAGFEALARWPSKPAGTSSSGPFPFPLEPDTVGYVDWACRAASFEAALQAHLSLPLFVNVEPEGMDLPCPAHWRAIVDRACAELTVVLEVTERALVAYPAELLQAVKDFRRQGFAIALDDVGIEWRSLALMPLIRPDVVKLDLSLVQHELTAHEALLTDAVRGYADRSGAQVVAEGIETEAHAQRAAELGATLGQGWLFGRPGALPTTTVTDRPVRPLRAAHAGRADPRPPG